MHLGFDFKIRLILKHQAACQANDSAQANSPAKLIPWTIQPYNWPRSIGPALGLGFAPGLSQLTLVRHLAC